MTHSHADHVQDYSRAFAIGIGLNVLYIVVEAGYGFWTNSLALLADAGHNLSDVAGLLLAWGAEALRQRKPAPRRTFGYRKVSVLAALAGGILLLVAMGAIIWEAIGRFQTPAPLNGWTIIIVASIGVLINGFTAWLFIGGQKEDLNIRSAFLHMAADTGISLGVVIGGLFVLFTKQAWIDPMLSLLIAAIVLVGSWSLFRDSAILAMDAVPPGINPEQVEKYLEELQGVSGIHDLHIWAISTKETALTVHLIMSDGGQGDDWLAKIADELYHQFNICHATIQIERNESTCPMVVTSDPI